MKMVVSQEIHVPRQIVFDALMDIPGYATPIPAITKCEVLTEGPVAIGTRFKETRVMFGKEATEVMEFTELDRPRGYLLEAHSHGMHYKTAHVLTEDNGVTTLTLTFDGTPETFGARVMGAIMTPLFKGAMRKAVVSDLQALKAHLEAG